MIQIKKNLHHKDTKTQRRKGFFAQFLRRVAAADFSRGFQSTEDSAPRRVATLNSTVADATRTGPLFPALKRRDFSRRSAAKKLSPSFSRSALWANRFAFGWLQQD